MPIESRSVMRPIREMRIPIRVALTYAIVATLWILFSDQLLALFVGDLMELTFFQTIKGILFVLVTASILYLILNRDVMTIQRSEQDLVESETRYRSLVEAISDWVWEVDQEARLTYSNPKVLDILGYRPEEIIGKTPYALMADDEAARVSKLFSDFASRQQPITLTENTLLHKEGYPVILEFSGMPIFEEGALRGYRGISRDITARKRAEDAVRERDIGIRRAYVDIFSAVTGGRLIIMTNDELIVALGEPISDIGTVGSYKDLAGARSQLREVLAQESPDSDALNELMLSASEAITNAVKHGGSGWFQVLKKDRVIQVKVEDHGPGIDFKILPKATLLAGFSTKQSLGIGFSIMLELCSRILLSTQPGNTTIVLERYLVEEQAGDGEAVFAV